MAVPLLDLKAQLKTIEPELKQAVMEVIDSTRYIGGPQIDELEAKIAEYVGADHGIGVTSGTDALLVAMMALGIGPGDIVLTPTYSFFATAGVVARLNATPAFIDCDPDTYNICPNALRAWFDREKNKRDRVKAIVPVHLYGQCADMDPILAIAGEYGVPVIEDAAQAIGSKYPSKSGIKGAGSMGAIGCFSFFPSKNLGGVGDGGMVVTSDAALAERIRFLRNHGANPKYYHKMIGGNFRLDPIQAAVLLVKLPHLDKWHQMRRDNAAYYDERLHLPGVKLPKVAYRREYHIYNQYIISVADRDGLRARMTEAKIGTEVYYPVPFHLQECFKDLGCKKGDFPNSEHAADHTLALPIYAELTSAQKDEVISQIRAFHG